MAIGLSERIQALETRINHHVSRGWKLKERHNDPPSARLRRVMEVKPGISAGISLPREQERVHWLVITIDEQGNHSQQVSDGQE